MKIKKVEWLLPTQPGNLKSNRELARMAAYQISLQLCSSERCNLEKAVCKSNFYKSKILCMLGDLCNEILM
jgi:hypothetical protein